MAHASRLTVDQLRIEIADGKVDTVLLAFTDMQGRLQGKRIAGPFFLSDVLGRAAEGCNYLLAVDVDMNTVDGYAMSSWDTGYGDFVLKPDLSTLHRVPVAPRHGRRARRPAVARRRPGRRLAAADPHRADRQAGRARLARVRRHRTGVHGLPRHLRGRLALRIPEPHPGEPVQRGLFAARHGPHRAAATPHPQRDGRRRHDRRVGEGRVQPRPARDRVQVRRGPPQPATTTSSTRTARRRSPPSRA